MAEQAIYESPLPWDAGNPGTTVITCVDGRWKRQIRDFVVEFLKVEPDADIFAVPGGIEPLTLMESVPEEFHFIRRRLEGLVAAHGTRRIVAVAHQDCAWYKSRKLGKVGVDLRERQIADLRRAAGRLGELFPEIQVETYFARFSESTPGRIVFDRI